MSTEANGVLTPEENVNNQASGTNEPNTASVLTLKNRGQVKEFNLSDPEELGKLQIWTQQVWRASEKNEDIASLAQSAEMWNGLLDEAKDGNVQSFDKVINLVENHVGRKISAAEKAEIKSGEETPFDDEFKQLNEKINGLQNELKSRDENAKKKDLNSRRDKLENQLVNMDTDKSYPHFDYDEMVDEMNRTGNLDPVSVYRNLYFDKILADAGKSVKSRTEDIQKKRERGFVESGSDVGAPKQEVGRSRNLEEAFQRRLEGLAAEDKSIFK